MSDTIRLDVFDLVQNVLEMPQFTPQLIALLDDDLRSSMTALATAVTCQDQAAANVALQALTAALEG